MLDELLSMTYVSLLLYVGCTYFYGGSSVERWRPFTSRRIPDAAKSFAARVLVGIENLSIHDSIDPRPLVVEFSISRKKGM
jgi:hypothetical protein